MSSVNNSETDVCGKVESCKLDSETDIDKLTDELSLWSDAILGGTNNITAVGTSGHLALFAPKAAPILLGKVNTDVVCAVAEYGKGRVAVVGHSKFIKEGQQAPDVIQFRQNLLRWVTRDELTIESIQTTVVNSRVTSLGGVDSKRTVVIYEGDPGITHGLVTEIEDFVKQGGGVIVGITSWGIIQQYPTILQKNWPINGLLKKIGIMFTDECIFAVDGRYQKAEYPQCITKSNIFHMLQNCLEHDFHARENIKSVAQIFRSLHDHGISDFSDDILTLLEKYTDQLVIPNRLKKLTDPFLIGLIHLYDLVLHHDTTSVAPGIEHFPGTVPTDCTHVTAQFNVSGSRQDFFNTGLYAAPGKPISIDLTCDVKKAVNWKVRIGAHTDNLKDASSLSRWPNIYVTRSLVEGTFTMVSKFGGSIYLDSPSTSSTVCLTISGAIESAYYNHHMSNSDVTHWDKRQELHAPWAEVCGKWVTFILPKSSILTTPNPGPVLAYWDKVVLAGYHLACLDPNKQRHRYVVADQQPIIGYMHGGYPIVTSMDVADPASDKFILKLDALKTQGCWALFHEFGHNLQESAWTASDSIEVTVNIFTLYGMETMHGILPLDHEWVTSKKSSITKALASKNPFEIITKTPGVAIGIYAQLAHHMGWEYFKHVFSEYQLMSKADLPKTDQNKRNVWAQKFQQVCGYCLVPLYEFWGIPISDCTKEEMLNAGLENYLPNDWITDLAPERLDMVVSMYPSLTRDMTRSDESTHPDYSVEPDGKHIIDRTISE